MSTSYRPRPLLWEEYQQNIIHGLKQAIVGHTWLLNQGQFWYALNANTQPRRIVPVQIVVCTKERKSPNKTPFHLRLFSLVILWLLVI